MCDRKTPVTVAELLNDRVIPFYEEHDVPLQHRVLRIHDRHEYELYLAVENIAHTRSKTKSPQTNGIVERFHKTLLDEFYRVAFRRKVYDSVAARRNVLCLSAIKRPPSPTISAGSSPPSKSASIPAIRAARHSMQPTPMFHHQRRPQVTHTKWLPRLRKAPERAVVTPIRRTNANVAAASRRGATTICCRST
jgi:hypothetical protein